MRAIFFVLLFCLNTLYVGFQAQAIEEKKWDEELSRLAQSLESNQKHFSKFREEVKNLERDISQNKKRMDKVCLIRLDQKNCQKEKEEFETLEGKHDKFTEILEKINKTLEGISREVKTVEQITLKNQINILKNSLLYEQALIKAYFRKKITDTLNSEAFCSAMKRDCKGEPIPKEKIDDELFKKEDTKQNEELK